jgi:protein TonB
LVLLIIAPPFATGTRFVRQRFEVIPPYGGTPQPTHPATGQQVPPNEHRFPKFTNPMQVIAPTRVPTHVAESDGASPADMLPNANNFASPGHGNSSGPVGLVPIFDDRVGLAPPQPPATSAPVPRAPISISQGVQLALLIHRVEPIYPIIAKQSHVQGTVQIRAIIARDGSVEQLEVLSGPPLLVRAARDAVLLWRFHPTLLNGEPVEVQTYFTVVFHLGQ